MRLINTFTLAAFASSLTLAPMMHADEWDKKTTITINAPVQIPSTTLQPGTYTLKLMDSNSDRHIVTVWDKDGMHLITTILAIPNTRLTPTGKSKFTFWETPAGEPAALKAWFYPGDNFGQEFAYPKAQAADIARASHVQVTTMSEKDEEKYGGKNTETAKMTTTTVDNTPTQAPAETTVATTPEPTAEVTSAPAAAMPAPSPAANANPEPPAAEPTAAPAAPEPTPAPAAAEQQPATTTPDPAAAPMPATASNWNETMSFGLLLSLTGLSTFLVRKKRA